jgi:hypothetical protein
LDYGLTILLVILNIGGAVALFQLRRIAVPLFCGALALNIVMMIWHSLSKGWLAAMGDSATLGAFVGLGILSVICLYARGLALRGALT